MSGAPRRKMDALLLLLKANAAGGRRRSWAVLILLVVLLLVPLVLLAWWVLRSKEVPPVLVAAYDQVTVPDQSTLLRGQVEALDPDKSDASLAGCDLFFLNGFGTELLGKVVTDARGRAAIERRFPMANEAAEEFLIRCPGEKRGQATEEGRASIFVWPPESLLLIVDTDHALMAAADDDAAADFRSRQPLRGACRILQTAQEKYRIVYLSAGADRPRSYRQVRNALLRQEWERPSRDKKTVEVERLPAGPVLGRAAYPDAADAAAFHATVLAELKQRFTGNAVGVAGRPEVAQAFQAAGLKTFLITDQAEAPEGVTAVVSWADLAKQLP